MHTNGAVILTRNPYLYTVQRFERACGRAGVDCRVIDPFLISVHLGRKNSRLEFAGSPLSPGVAINRLSSLAGEYAVQVLAEMERGGALCINPAKPTADYRHKFAALQTLENSGVPVPETRLVRSGQDLNAAVEELGGPPVVLKFARGAQGLGVIWAESRDTAVSVIESLNLIQYDGLLQRYYPAARELDLRVLVLGGRVLGAVKRVAGEDDFRSNFHRGGMLYKYELSPELEELAVKASAALGTHFAGVDIIETGSGPVVLEVNLSPGFEGFDKVYSADIAKEVLDWALEQSNNVSE